MKRVPLLLLLFYTPVVADASGQTKKVVNDNYGYSVEMPTAWAAKRIKHTDPFPDINEFKAGRAELKGEIDTGAKEPADWNALQINGMQEIGEDGRAKYPQLTMYAHPHGAKTFAQFTSDLGAWLDMFRMKLESSKQKKTKSGADVYEYAYKMGPMTIRLAMLYGNGVRYGVMYLAKDSVSLKKDAPAFDSFVSSIQLKKPLKPAPVK